jgi:adenosine deaminase
MTGPAEALTRWLRAMPKAELHLHLDGSMRPKTALELARTRSPRDIAVPADLTAMLARLTAPPRCRDQAELLQAFELPIALLQDAEALAQVTAELVEDVASDGTRYAEIRWAPALHMRGGLSLAAGMATVAQAAAKAGAEHGVEIRLIAVALRTHDPALAVDVAHAAVALAGEGVTGFDLAGIEMQARDPAAFGDAFALARAGGLGITCHAGEWGGAVQVWGALSVDPWRIAHGAPAVDDPALTAELRHRGISLDLCPTSNLQAGVGTDGPDAPLPRLLRAGVAVTISTDDRTVSDLTLVAELRRSVERLGLTPAEIVAVNRTAYDTAFLHQDEDIRRALRQRFEAWLLQHPSPG